MTWLWYFLFAPSSLIKAQDELIASQEKMIAVQRFIIDDQDKTLAQLRRRKRK